MFARRVMTSVVRGGMPTRNFSSGGLPTALYNTVWRKSTPLYITYILIGCVVTEMVYGHATRYVFDKINEGKSFEYYDMERFPVEGEEDDE
mmetsp:Transcript_23951/g.35161  ORF Transcript_23951/g.35161 Transcript_23951/m.35161 type:complete len:91 (+) Transcript_23951:66-338(+)